MARIISSGATHHPEEAPLAYDGDPATRWTSGEAMQPTMAYWLTLDAPAMIGGISATTPEPNDNPRAWKVVILDSDGGHGRKEVASGAGIVSATFAPVRGQVVRIEQTGEDSYFWWSITNLTIDAVDIVIEEPPPEPAVTDVGWGTWDEATARFVVEALAVKFGWPCFQREVVDFTIGKGYVKQAIVYTTGVVQSDGDRDFWPLS